MNLCDDPKELDARLPQPIVVGHPDYHTRQFCISQGHVDCAISEAFDIAYKRGMDRGLMDGRRVVDRSASDRQG